MSYKNVVDACVSFEIACTGPLTVFYRAIDELRLTLDKKSAHLGTEGERFRLRNDRAKGREHALR